MDTPTLIDAHCHLGFSTDADALAAACVREGIGLFDCGVDPSDFAGARARDARYNAIAAGVGLHPWWIADGRCGKAEVELLCELAARERFIGEVGLDFSPRFAGTEEMQLAAFERLCATIDARPLPRRVISIHAVRAAGAVLDTLGAHGLLDSAAGTPSVIFHWFSGTSKELSRARAAGCYFSINERMLKTRRGREYARQIPLDRLLLETDLPGEPGSDLTAAELRAALERTAASIAELKRMTPQAIARATTENWLRISS